MRSFNTLNRLWRFPELRADYIEADLSKVNSGSNPAIRLPPFISRGSIEWKEVEKAVRINTYLQNPISIGYSFFSADISAADEPVFDPQLESLNIESEFFTQTL